MKPAGIIAIFLTLGLLAGILWATTTATQATADLKVAVQEDVKATVSLIDGFVTDQGVSLSEAAIEAQALSPEDIRIVLYEDGSGYVVHVARALNPEVTVEPETDPSKLYNFGYNSRTNEYSEMTWEEITQG